MIHAQTRYFTQPDQLETVLHYVQSILFPLATKAGCQQLQTCVVREKGEILAHGNWPSHDIAEQFAQEITKRVEQDLLPHLTKPIERELLEIC